MQVVHVAAAALLGADGQVLVAQRTAGRMAGLWEFPGGKIEPQETPEQALARELEEELGIRIDRAAPLTFVSHRYPDFHLVMLVYAVTGWAGEPVGRLGQPLRWVTSAELGALAMPAADLPLIPAVARAAAAVASA